MVFGIFTAIGGAICSAVNAITTAVSNFLPVIKAVIEVVCKVATIIGQALGIIPKEQEIEDFGDRVIQAEEAGIKPENFDKYDDYLKEIQNFQLDPEKSKQISVEDKRIAGIATVAKGIDEKFDLNNGVGASMMMMAASNPNFFTADRMLNWLQSGTVDMNKVVAYFDNKLDGVDSMKVKEDLIKAEKSNEESDLFTQTEKEIGDKIFEMKNEFIEKTQEN